MIYKWKPTDKSIKINTSKIPLGGLTIIMPKIPNNLDKMRDVTPLVTAKKLDF